MLKKVEDFLIEVNDQKVKQLLGIALDTKYFESIIGDKEEDVKLRIEMEAENSKRTFKKNGEILEDKRDMPKVKVLQARIDEIAKAQQEVTKLGQMDAGIKQYLKYVNSPSEEMIKELEELTK